MGEQPEPDLTEKLASYLGRLPRPSVPYKLMHPLLEAWWPNLLSFALTVLSTTLFGAALAESFGRGQGLDETGLARSYVWLLHGDNRLWSGLIYSVPLLLILLAHEFGHYGSCQRWGVRATLPYFGPSPTLLGTVGAFIWIRSPIYNRRSLFDIGVSGPICGFVVLMPFLWAGVARSHVETGGQHALFSFGTPLLLRLMEQWLFPGVAAGAICLHPMAVAAWAGMLATAMNLLPVGQLDGGHILYGLLGARWHERVSLGVVAALVVAGFFYWAWWIWAAVLFFFRKHPFIYDEEPLNSARRWVGAVAMVLLVLSFVVVPVRMA